jgi:signal transduction histidine kinase
MNFVRMFFCIIAIYYDCPIHIIFFVISVEIIITILIIAVNMILNNYLRLRHAHVSIRHLIDKVTLQDLIQFISRKRHQQ